MAGSHVAGRPCYQRAMRTRFVAGNWKLNKTIGEAMELVGTLERLGAEGDVHVAVAPPFTAIVPVVQRLASSAVQVAAQDCHWEERGAWTGEVSPSLLADAGCRWV